MHCRSRAGYELEAAFQRFGAQQGTSRFRRESALLRLLFQCVRRAAVAVELMFGMYFPASPSLRKK